jgi:carboxymethylenebutenolidase
MSPNRMNPDIRTEFITLNVSDGTTMRAYAARPEGPVTQSGLLVFQEAYGVNTHIRDVTERFARKGYFAVAPELFHRTGPGFEGRYDDFPSAMAHLQALKVPELEADLQATHAWLRANASNLRIASVGYCMGGRVSFLAALTLPLACAVSYYGGGIAPNPMGPGLLNRASELRAPVLFFWGGRDQHIGPEQTRAVTDALRAASKDYVNIEFSDAGHAFFCDARPSYNPLAAAQAWPITLNFLRLHAGAGRAEDQARRAQA